MYNRWVGVGNLTSDPKLKRGSDDDGKNDMCMFSIAINKPGQDAAPTYVDCICWGKLAGQVHDFGSKGRMVLVEGEYEVRKWETEDGETRRNHRMKAWVVRFLDKPKEKRHDDGDGWTDEPPQQRTRDSASDFDDLPF